MFMAPFLKIFCLLSGQTQFALPAKKATGGLPIAFRSYV